MVVHSEQTEWSLARKERDEWKARALAAEGRCEKLGVALSYIAEEHDAGRHDGKPEACPAHDAVEMWLCALTALKDSEQ